MMTLCVTVLFIITFSVFLLSIFVLVRFHEQPSDETIMIASQPLEMNQMNYQTIYSRFCDRLKLNYPELPLLFDDISIDDYNTEEFHVTGTSFRENDIESIGIENYEFDYSRKDFLEIFSEGQRIYKYLFAPKSVVLEEEPDNKYDKL